MEQINDKLVRLCDNSIGWYCPGCESFHRVTVDPTKRPCWNYDGNPDAPTFSPSILTRWTEHRDGLAVGMVCHCFIRNGKIEFLGDCTHSLAGKTVQVPDLPK
jgi:hypothetical protein